MSSVSPHSRLRRTTVVGVAAVIALVAGLIGTVAAQAAAEPTLLVAATPDRAGAQSLNGATLSGDRFVFVEGDGIKRVYFYLDNPSATGTPTKTEGKGPWDYAGTAGDNSALPWATSAIADGTHSITAVVDMISGPDRTLTGTFTVANNGPTLVASPASVSAAADLGGAAVTATVRVTSPQAVTFGATADRPWVTAAVQSSTSTEVTYRLTLNPAGLAAGVHTAGLTVTGGSLPPLLIPVQLTVNPPAGQYALQVAQVASRSGAVALQGTTLAGDAYVFLAGDGISVVDFFLDNPAASGTPLRTERTAPYDLFGGSVSTATKWDTTGVADGSHSVTARVTRTDGTSTLVTSSFTVSNAAARLVASPTSVTLTPVQGGAPVSTGVAITSSSGASFTPSVTDDRDWITTAVAGSGASRTVTVSVNPTGLPTGTVTGSVTVSAPGFLAVAVPVTAVVQPPGGTAAQLRFSAESDRAPSQPLEAATLIGNVFPFLEPNGTSVTSVSFWIDDPARTGPAARVDNAAPFDLAGSNPGGSTAQPWNSAGIPDGTHTLTAVATGIAGSVVIQATFTTANGTNQLTFAPSSAIVESEQGGGLVPVTASLTSTTATTATLTSNAQWLTVTNGTTVTTPATVQMAVDPQLLSPGTYTATVTATASGAFAAAFTVTAVIGTGSDCVPVACELIKVPTPYSLNWLYDPGLLLDRDGQGTGFTMAMTEGGGTYDRSKIDVDFPSSSLAIDTTSGGFSSNDQDNAIGVGFDGQLDNTTIATTLRELPAGTTGKYEQAGLWLGYAQQHHARISVQDAPSGWRVEFTVAEGGQTTYKKVTTIGDVVGPIRLFLVTNPAGRTLTAYYQLPNAGATSMGQADVPGEFYSFDAAGIDPIIGTRSFAGIYASDRTGPPTRFAFDDFELSSQAPGAAVGNYQFDRVSYDTAFPTALAFGPDGKLYTTDLMGDVHRLTVGADHAIVDEDVIDFAGQPRMALGIAIGPESTPNNVVVYVAHSSPVTDHGIVDSGIVSRLSGTNLENRQDVITGLPRSYANHGPNNLHFGPDGRLYLAMGGNTGAGAPNTANTEFGDRGEQELSAALVVADINAPGFDGTCQNAANMYGPAPCDVEVFASGLRNSYDFVHHSNGNIYATDNGLGVVGTFPTTTTPPCGALADTKSWKNGGNNPGEQPDEINLVEAGKYYGHPNPARGECVFKDGSYQSVPAPANYRAPIFETGINKSSNGVVEYRGEAFCGDLDGHLLYTNYSVGDDLVLARLSADGRSVVSTETLADGFGDPLPVTVGPDGAIWVGEFGADKLTALVPRELGCWDDAPALPVEILDTAGAAVGDKMYVVAGKDGSYRDTLWIYDSVSRTWAQGPALPGGGVENPAVVAVDGKVYAFGGSVDPFGQTRTTAAVYTPGTNSWQSLPSMPTGRTGASAVAVGGKIYVIGGMDTTGASLTSVDVFTISTGTWSTGPALVTARDNAPATVAPDGTIYVFGGRTREATGKVLAQTLDSVEVLAPGAGSWAAGPILPTARRTGAAVTLPDGRLAVLGGEVRADGAAFDTVELLDPATGEWSVGRSMPGGRHGFAAAVIGEEIHVVGGAPQGGFGTSSTHWTYAPAP